MDPISIERRRYKDEDEDQDKDGDNSNNQDRDWEDNIKENPTVKERQAHGYETPGVAFYLLSVQSIS